jgi:hypothetical protein
MVPRISLAAVLLAGAVASRTLAAVSIETRPDPMSAADQLWVVNTAKSNVTIEVVVKPWNYPGVEYPNMYVVPPGRSMIGWKHPLDRVLSVTTIDN